MRREYPLRPASFIGMRNERRRWRGMMGIALSIAGLTLPAQRVMADPAVVVELFTSEGCSSCPPADELLSKYVAASPVKGATIVPLALHVDYWDRLGWRDVFSSRAFSQRQESYAHAQESTQIYTPQMIVDGQAAFVGSDADQAVAAIKQQASAQKATVAIELSADAKSPDEIHTTVKLAALPAAPAGEHYTLMLAVTEDELVSDVRHGENAGRQLHHDAVARSLTAAGDVTAGATTQNFESAVRLDPSWKREHLHVIAFVQASGSLRIVGAGSVTLPK